jgi:hypothetical protein
MFNVRTDLDKAARRFRKKKEPGGYRHIKVVDKIDTQRKVRSLTVECPLEYPGLSEPERRRMYEGLAMIAEAFRDADERCERNHYKRK